MLAEAIRRFFAEQGLAPGRVVAAVSGGIDSTALLLAMAELRPTLDLVAAHVNHHLRGAESDGDEAFLREVCAGMGAPLHVANGDLDPRAVRDRGIEAAAREVRFARLHEIAQACGASMIATAHQMNDQAETVLMRLLTGSSLAARRGIHPVRDDGVIRPLLGVSRREIAEWLHARGVEPRLDRSNDDMRFLRNRVRMLLAGAPESAVRSLAASAGEAAAQWRVLERAIDAAEDAEVEEHATRFRSLPSDPWLRQALLHRHIVRLDPARARDVGARDLERLARETSPRVSVTGGLELLRGNGTVVLRHTPRPVAPFEVPLTPTHPARIGSLGLVVSLSPGSATVSGGWLVTLPRGSCGQLAVRNRRPGDRFHPPGYSVPVKLKDFLINRKIPREERDRIPLLVWNREIVWVAGIAVAEPFRKPAEEGDAYRLTCSTL